MTGNIRGAVTFEWYREGDTSFRVASMYYVSAIGRVGMTYASRKHVPRSSARHRAYHVSRYSYSVFVPHLNRFYDITPSDVQVFGAGSSALARFSLQRHNSSTPRQIKYHRDQDL